ncbi:MAG: site-specific integrase [Alphaproteobacteria bacterium]|nr:MAG: site-specific integrase [Alphaproteobacteria bacterium]
MPRKAKELSALAVSRLRADGRHAVGGADGLHLRVAGASRAWVLRAKVGARRCDIGLGPFPEVTLAEARDAAIDLRRQIRRGVDPLEERKQARLHHQTQRQPLVTFRSCAEKFVEMNQAGWKNTKHAAQWSATLKTYAFPTIGETAVAAVDTPALLAILQPIWTTKTETASRLRGRIEAVLDWARVQGFRDGDNPARWRGHLDKTLPPRRRVQGVTHHAALPYTEVAALIRELQARPGTSARALEFSILCASRSGEVRGALWDEFDLEAAIWTIPADRMKAGKEHRVPLSPQANQLLRSLPRFDKEPHVFGAPRGGPLSDMSLTAVLKRMGQTDITQHGFRSTFRDWAGETTNYAREVIEHALAHQLKDKAEAAYQRGDLLQKRTALMKDWADFCTRKPTPD